MIEARSGDILNAGTEALVNTVNCVGVMGRGLALQFRNEFPDNFAAYKAACEREDVQPVKMFVFDLRSLQNPRYVINFPTKRHWKGNSRLEDVHSGLASLVSEIRNRAIRSVVFGDNYSSAPGVLIVAIHGGNPAAWMWLGRIELGRCEAADRCCVSRTP